MFDDKTQSVTFVKRGALLTYNAKVGHSHAILDTVHRDAGIRGMFALSKNDYIISRMPIFSMSSVKLG